PTRRAGARRTVTRLTSSDCPWSGRQGSSPTRSIGRDRLWPRGALRLGDWLRHQAKNLIHARDAAEPVERAYAPERFVEIGAGRRAAREVITAPHDRLAPQVHEGCAARRFDDPIAIGGQEELPELLGLDRIADTGIERAFG